MTAKHTCLYCRHFEFDFGEPDYSDMTPGSPPRIACLAGEFRMFSNNLDGKDVDFYSLDRHSFAEIIATGETCQKFSLFFCGPRAGTGWEVGS